MAHRQKNLLEAFSASAAAEKSESERASGSSAAGGPFAPEAPPPEAPPRVERPQLPPRKPSLSETLMHPENRGGLLVLVALGLTLAFLAGRATVSRVAAKEGGSPAATESEHARASLPTPDLETAPGGDEGGRPEQELSQEPSSPAERALLDPENRYTIKLVEYGSGDRDAELAWEAFDYLEEQGLPAAILGRGKRLFIVLGAAPRSADLDDLVEIAKTMNGPPPRSKKAEFFDAYVDKIDKFIDR